MKHPFWELNGNWYPLLDFQATGGIPLPTTPQLFRFETATSLPDHSCCQYLYDIFTESRHPQRPRLGASKLLCLSILPGHPRPQWLRGGVALARLGLVVWASLALYIQLILVVAFDCVSKSGVSFRITCIRCQIPVYPQTSDRRPCGLLPTPCV